MGAYINALREEGTRADLLKEVERLLEQRDTLREAVRLFLSFGCPACGGDCHSANPPVFGCPMLAGKEALEN